MSQQINQCTEVRKVTMSLQPFKWGEEADEKGAITIRERNRDDPRNSNRQYEWVLAAADAQHDAIRRHGVIRFSHIDIITLVRY